CSPGNGTLALFMRGGCGDLLLKWWDGVRWSEYASLGSPEVPDASYPVITVSVPLTGPPAACSWNSSRLDVFARGAHGNLIHKWWNGVEWSAFESLGMPRAGDNVIPFSGAVTACTSAENSLDVVAGAIDGRLYHARWDGTWLQPANASDDVQAT